MPTNITTVAGWVTPQSVSSSDAVSSTLWNTLSNDVALLYGKPWIFAFQTANTTTTPFVNSTSGTGVGTPIFKTSTVGGSYGTLANSPASGLGSFSVTSSTGVVNFPTSSGTAVPGLYRISVQLMTGQNSTNFQRPIIVVQGGGSVLSYHPGPWIQSTTSSGVYPAMIASVVIPVGYGTWASASNFYVTGQVNASTTANLLATDSGANGPNSTPPVYNSWVFAEYLGTSTGSF
jgi:hypothetical protein